MLAECPICCWYAEGFITVWACYGDFIFYIVGFKWFFTVRAEVDPTTSLLTLSNFSNCWISFKSNLTIFILIFEELLNHFQIHICGILIYTISSTVWTNIHKITSKIIYCNFYTQYFYDSFLFYNTVCS